MRSVVLLLVLAACGTSDRELGDDGPGDDDPGYDVWIIEREAVNLDWPEPPNCPEFEDLEREIRLRGRYVGAAYELVAESTSVRVVGDRARLDGEGLAFETEEAWPLAVDGVVPPTMSVVVDYDDIAEPAQGFAGTVIYVPVDLPDIPDWACYRDLRILSVRRG